MARIAIALFMFAFTLSTTNFAQWPKLSNALLNEQRIRIEEVKKSPNNPDARFNLAMHFAQTGWVEQGWRQLKQIPKLDPDYAKKKEIDLFNEIQKDPKNWDLHFKIAFAYYFNNKKSLSLASFLKAQHLNPNQAWVMGFVALVYGDKKNYKKTIYWTKKALKLEPHGTALHYLLAKAYKESGHYLAIPGEAVHLLNARSREKKYRPEEP